MTTEENPKSAEKNPSQIIRHSAALAAGAGVIPLPLADIGAIASIQYAMVKDLSAVYGHPIDKNKIKLILSAVVSGTFSRMGASLIQVIPVIGCTIGGMSVAISGAISTFALGQAIKNHFDQGGTVEDFDLEQLKKWYRKAANTFGPRLSTLLPQWLGGKSREEEKVEQLESLYRRGIIDEDVYESTKERIKQKAE